MDDDDNLVDFGGVDCFPRRYDKLLESFYFIIALLDYA